MVKGSGYYIQNRKHQYCHPELLLGWCAGSAKLILHSPTIYLKFRAPKKTLGCQFLYARINSIHTVHLSDRETIKRWRCCFSYLICIFCCTLYIHQYQLENLLNLEILVDQAQRELLYANTEHVANLVAPTISVQDVGKVLVHWQPIVMHFSQIPIVISTYVPCIFTSKAYK